MGPSVRKKKVPLPITQACKHAGSLHHNNMMLMSSNQIKCHTKKRKQQLTSIHGTLPTWWMSSVCVCRSQSLQELSKLQPTKELAQTSMCRGHTHTCALTMLCPGIVLTGGRPAVRLDQSVPAAQLWVCP